MNAVDLPYPALAQVMAHTFAHVIDESGGIFESRYRYGGFSFRRLRIRGFWISHQREIPDGVAGYLLEHCQTFRASACQVRYRAADKIVVDICHLSSIETTRLLQHIMKHCSIRTGRYAQDMINYLYKHQCWEAVNCRSYHRKDYLHGKESRFARTSKRTWT